MFLPTKDGIICDYCATTYKNKFTYFSTKAILCQVKNNTRIPPQNADLNSDMCQSCYDKLLDRVKQYLGKAHPNKIKCDLSKSYGSGTFDYYKIYFDRIDVDKERIESEQVKIEPRAMDLNVINGFNELLAQTQVTKKKVEQEGRWT